MRWELLGFLLLLGWLFDLWNRYGETIVFASKVALMLSPLLFGVRYLVRSHKRQRRKIENDEVWARLQANSRAEAAQKASQGEAPAE